MRMFSITRYLRRLPVIHKFYFLIVLTLFVLLLEVLSFWFVMNTMSALRAYVGGEGLWSKAQKESVNSLLRYSTSKDEADYQRSLSYLAVPLGDHRARIELEKQDSDLAVVRQGFLEGGNHPDDFEEMIFLFKKFRNVSYMSQAIDTWTTGDTLIEKQLSIAESMHRAITAPEVAARGIPELVEELVSNDAELTKLEDRFSAVLGEGSRSVGLLLFGAIALLTLLFGAMSLFIVLFIGRLVNRIDIAKSEFVALVSHQLRTPLTVIKLSGEVLKKGDIRALTPEGKVAIENISHEVGQMAALIDTILDVSRIELGALVVDLKEIDLIKAARSAAAEASLDAQKKDIKVEEEYDPPSLLIAADPTLVQVIFQNLLSNAVKYSPPGGTVHLTVRRAASKVEISVSDTGYGIPKEQQEQIFSKLFRGRIAGEDPGGTGLGLYIVKSIVDEAGGRIWFDSTEGKGTTFYVSFPPYGMEKKVGNVRLSAKS